ncbi:hypothetical protein [Isoptericola sp. NPDC055881]
MTQAPEREATSTRRAARRRLPWNQIAATIVGVVILIAAAIGWSVTG